MDQIEKHLKECWSDKRLFEIWAEYYTAVKIKEIHPDWNVRVSDGRRVDVICEFNGETRKIQVKTGKWQNWPFSKGVLVSADGVPKAVVT